ncbi:hypothetical protein EJB05_02949 [Eragrostis curvula]|uniref:Uncharacterized protein n=1 Tax=Eragrostis curvula TaxID=38414 RepID=A0A5J9WUL3_9POAL|nr:hypothetical protein EJB05_02949 [Eragrostis curvula]
MFTNGGENPFTDHLDQPAPPRVPPQRLGPPRPSHEAADLHDLNPLPSSICYPCDRFALLLAAAYFLRMLFLLACSRIKAWGGAGAVFIFLQEQKLWGSRRHSSQAFSLPD